MKRRDFLALAGAAGATAALPRLAIGQAGAKPPRVALVSSAVPPSVMYIGLDPGYSPLLEQMESDGFVEGRTVIYERYLVPGPQVAELMPNIVASNPNVIFCGGTAPATLTAMALTKSIPIVSWLDDLIARGVVTNLARPGGNVTGLNAVASVDAQATLTSLLAEAAPKAKKFAFVASGTDGKLADTHIPSFALVSSAAVKLGLSMEPVVLTPGDSSEANYVRAFGEIVARGFDAVQFGNDVINQIGAPIEAQLALRAKKPGISQNTEFADKGGLMAYGYDQVAQSREAADIIALILNGANPGDIPVDQPRSFLLQINMGTAKQMGLTIPTSLLVRATKVID